MFFLFFSCYLNFFNILFLKNLFIIFGCTGSSLLCMGFVEAALAVEHRILTAVASLVDEFGL